MYVCMYVCMYRILFYFYVYKKSYFISYEDMGKKLVSKPGVMSLSGVSYPNVSKKIFTQLTKPSATKIFSIN